MSNFKKALKCVLLAGVSSFAVSTSNPQAETIDNENIALQTQTPTDTLTNDSAYIVDNPLKIITYRNDTLNYKATALLYYKNKTITRNFVKGSRFHQIDLTLFSHEDWHEHNKKYEYWKKYKYSPSQMIQLRMHEEIAPNIVSIVNTDLELRYSSNPDSIIDSRMNSYMRYYLNSLYEKRIMLNAYTPDELDKKYSLLVNGGIYMWTKLFCNHYKPSLMSELKKYILNYGFHHSHPKNYNRALTHMYHIGGLYLSKYIETDAYFDDPKIKILDYMADVSSFKQPKELREILVNTVFDDIDKLKGIDDKHLSFALTHMFIAAKLKYEMQKINPYTVADYVSAVRICHNKVTHQLFLASHFNKFIDNCENLFVSHKDNICSFDMFKSYPLNDKEKGVIRHFYDFQGINLSSFINGFESELNSNYPQELPMYNHSIYDSDPCRIPYSNSYFSMLSDKPDFKQLSSSVSNISIMHLSKPLFCTIPDFEQSLLVPGALSEEAQQKLRQFYQDYHDIPAVFKSCNVEAQQNFISQNGVDPHYFEDKDDPLKPHNERIKIKNSMFAYHKIERD